MNKRPKPVSNRIALLRQAAGLTTRGLAERIATSAAQIERWEAGHGISPQHVPIIALALAETSAAIFPDLAKAQPSTASQWKALGFDPEASTFTWELAIQLRSHADSFTYVVDQEVALHVDELLRRKFLNFHSNGRRVMVAMASVQSVTVSEVMATLIPGSSYDAAALDPSYSNLQIYFRDRPEFLCMDAYWMNADDVANELSKLERATPSQGDFLPLREERDLVFVRSDDIALIEQPLPELLEEMRNLPDGFWGITT
jgi:transcriptional regulator with XRE-family HTH domain